jgi:hypothetical protein
MFSTKDMMEREYGRQHTSNAATQPTGRRSASDHQQHGQVNGEEDRRVLVWHCHVGGAHARTTAPWPGAKICETKQKQHKNKNEKHFLYFSRLVLLAISLAAKGGQPATRQWNQRHVGRMILPYQVATSE